MQNAVPSASRRHFFLGSAAAAAWLATGCASTAPSGDAAPARGASGPQRVPIVFVHGNGDSAALWMTTIWRFESAGWPRNRLHAIDLPYPLARDDDAVSQLGRSSTGEHMAFLRKEVDRVLLEHDADRCVLIGNSRGGNAIRNYIQNGGGDRTVSHAILGGTPNHGIWSIPGYREGNEFSATGPFLQALNKPKGDYGTEATPGPRWMTIRSDSADKYAQPTGEWIGLPGKPTGITEASPELTGATNVVLPRVDHRETAFSAAAFDPMCRFLTGFAPAVAGVTPEAAPVLDGLVTGLGLHGDDPASGSYPNNLPLAGAKVEVFATHPTTGQRQGPAAHVRTTDSDGRWGPFTARPDLHYEFVITAPGYAITHIYRSPFPRGTRYLHLRPERLADADRNAAAVVVFTRPRGYFDATRDAMVFDGSAALPGVLPARSPGVASSRLRLPAAARQRTVAASFNGEQLAGLTWPIAEGHIALLELTY